VEDQVKRITTSDVTDLQIRHLFNSLRDGTANDAVMRHICQVALGERVVYDETHPSGHVYPTAVEIEDAKRRCAEAINRRQS
jgi:hypothetical protein